MTPTPTIRWAHPHEGLLVRHLLKSNRLLVADELDWTQPLGPFWLLACLGQPVGSSTSTTISTTSNTGSYIGCIMVNPGIPIGRLDLLAVRDDLTHRLRAITVRDLCYAGFAVLKSQGSQMVMTGCATDKPAWKRIMQRRRVVFTEPIELGLKRL